ncbi:MAG: transcriptional repressor, partial [Chloroflexi bacterium]|nr:transcriptional repressor [Chloroflexota bacterium]
VCPSLGLVTVYRTLDVLNALELVRCAHRDRACHGFLPATQGHHHVIICQRCHRAVEFPGDEDLEGLFRRIEERTGYRVCDHLLQLAGLCPECQQEETHGILPKPKESEG